MRLMASEDNPFRGGKLWIGGARQAGSLFILAHSGTLYEQLGFGDRRILPDVVSGSSWTNSISRGYS